jgi:hypothetical protein
MKREVHPNNVGKLYHAAKSFEDAWIAFIEITIEGDAQGATKSGDRDSGCAVAFCLTVFGRNDSNFIE